MQHCRRRKKKITSLLLECTLNRSNCKGGFILSLLACRDKQEVIGVSRIGGSNVGISVGTSGSRICGVGGGGGRSRRRMVGRGGNSGVRRGVVSYDSQIVFFFVVVVFIILLFQVLSGSNPGWA